MKLYILSAAVLFFLFLTFFCRQFPKYNRWFAVYLLFTVGLQVLFAASIPLGLLEDVPMWMLAVPAWIFIGIAALGAARSQDAVNGIIGQGAAMIIGLNALGALLIFLHMVPESVRSAISNVAGVVPAGYMLVRFTFVDSDFANVFAGFIQHSRFNIQEAAGLAAGVARSLLG